MNPYENLPERHFWSTAVAKRNMFDIDQLWEPKAVIRASDAISTFGSCFAQHFGRALVGRGFNWFLAEAAPADLNEGQAREFNYGVFSARTGNIYTASLLNQWVGWAAGTARPPAETWEKDGRFFDPFRPNIEPNGFKSREELVASREMAIEAFRKCITDSQVFVFTLGLTESWVNVQGYEYPMCPGTVAGTFDAKKHRFVNQDYPFIAAQLKEAIGSAREINPALRFLLTVSPVPLTATASGQHVLVATVESKSVLRAVAGNVARHLDFVDYFPSYEIISSTPFRGTFFEPNQRSVNKAGVDHVMSSFFGCLEASFPEDPESAEADGKARGKSGAARAGQAAVPDAVREARRKKRAARLRRERGAQPADVVCEEELLNAFGGGKGQK
jgi:hypothetical protein